MKKTSLQKLLLTQAVLASTLFVATSEGVRANTIINTELTTTQQTNGADNNTLQITNVGAVTVNNNDGVLINSVGGKLIIDPNNIHGTLGVDAVQITGTGTFSGVLFSKANGVLTIGKNSGIDNQNTDVTSSAVGIQNTATDAVVTNNGIIVNASTGSTAVQIGGAAAIIGNNGSILNKLGNTAIHVLATGTDATINNADGAAIANGTGALAETILSDGAGFALNNKGTILQSAAFNTITLNQTVDNFVNEGNGLIKQDAVGGTAVILVNGGGTGAFENRENATIIATKTGTQGIQFENVAFNGNFSNAGNITTQDSSALAISVDFSNPIVNQETGTISRSVAGGAEAAIRTFLPVTLSGGFTNRGTINGIGGGGAIDFGTTPTSATYRQENGTVNGNVLLAQFGSAGGSDVFVMDGGSILGNVTAASIGNNVLQLNGGTIGGTVQLGALGDTVNLAGTTIVGPLLGGAGNDIVNVTGGNFNLLDGKGGVNTLNVNATFTPNGPIAFMGNINVNNTGTIFTVNNPITDMNGTGLTIAANTTVRLNSNIQGSGKILNNGLIDLLGDSVVDLSTGPNGILNTTGSTVYLRDNVLTLNSNIAGAYVNQAGANLKVDVVGLVTPSSMLTNGNLKVLSAQANAVNLDPLSIVTPVVKGYIPDAARFDIVSVVGGGTVNPVFTKINQPASAFLSFTEQFNDADATLSLIAHQNSFQQFVGSEVTEGVAGALDAIAAGNGLDSPILLNLLTQFQGLTSPQDIEVAMQSLIPPFNYGLVAGSHLGMDVMFDGVIKRLSDKIGRTRIEVAQAAAPATNGKNFGDSLGFAGLWGQVLGGHLNQSLRHNLPGYRAKGAGLAIGGDWAPNDCTLFGLAASYTKVNVDDKNINPKDQSIKSWQGTAYGWWGLMNDLYLDATVGIASNHYKTNRVIHVNALHTGAHADFDGTQYGAQVDLGWDLTCCPDYYLAPFLRLKYIHLDLDDYTETGELGLHVDNQNVKEFLGGAGFRLGWGYRCGEVTYVPEISAMIAYDFQNDGEQTFAGFIAGGPGFATNGIKPGRTIFDLGLGVNTYLSCDSILGIKYNLELRSQFVGNSLYLQYNYLWS